MSHTTYSYTRDKLGFEPDREEPRLTHYAGVQSYQANGHSYSNGKTAHYADHQEQFGGVYEENLQTFKGELLRNGGGSPEVKLSSNPGVNSQVICSAEAEREA